MIHGNAVLAETLEAGIEEACVLIVAIPNSFEAGEIIASQRGLAPARTILACAYFGDEMEWLQKQGATAVVNGADEVANRLVSLLPDHRRGQPAASAH